MQAFTSLSVMHEGPIAQVTLQRPDVHNAFGPAMIAELTVCFAALAAAEGVRVVVLAGAGKSFCAGADLQWMRASLAYTYDENIADAQRLLALYTTVNALPKPLIGRVHGAALGGGSGLVSCCDLVIAAEDAMFGFTETRLGILPAVISPFVVRKIGLSQARALFLNGSRFSAEHARTIGLIHQVVPTEELDEAVRRAAREFMKAGPEAIAATKQLLASLETLDPGAQGAATTAAIARARAGREGQAGLAAFLEKTRPPWSEL